MSRRLVHIKRTGPNPSDWSLKFEDGSDLPPIAALSIDVAAGEMPTLMLEVCDVDFEGTLPALWRVDFQTLVEMVADAGCEMNALGELGKVTEGWNKASAAMREVGAQAERLAEQNHRLKGELEESRAATATAERENTRLRRKVEDLRYANATHKDEVADARAETAQVTARLAELTSERFDLINTIARERRNHETTRQLAANAKLQAERDAERAPSSPTYTEAEVRRMIEDARAESAQFYIDREHNFRAEIRNLTRGVAQVQAERSADQFILAEAKADRLRLAKYEQENHDLKRRIALGAPALETAQVPAAETTRFTPILAVPTPAMRDAVQRTAGDALKVVCYQQSLMGLRSDLVLVAPPLPEQVASARFWEDFEGLVVPQLHCRLTPGGKLVRL